MRSAEESPTAPCAGRRSGPEAKVPPCEYKDEAEEWADENAEELRAHVRAQPITRF